MKENPIRRGATTALALVLTAVVAAPAVADRDDRRPASIRPVDLATVKVFSNGIDLAPNVRYSRAILTVTGMGISFEQEFDARTQLSIGFFDPEGELLPDGHYKWHLSLVPDETTAADLRRSAEANGGEATRPWEAKSGSFAIRGGAFASPDEIEEGVARRLAAEARESRSEARSDAGSQTFAGQVLGEKALGAGPPVVDTDDAVLGGFGDEAALLKGAFEAAQRPEARGRETGQSTGPDSDRETLRLGIPMEKALQPGDPEPWAAAPVRPEPATDGKNGRPHSDR